MRRTDYLAGRFLCLTHAGMAVDSVVRMPRHHGSASTGTIGGWARSGSARGDQGAERGCAEIGVSAARSERPMTAAPVESEWR